MKGLVYRVALVMVILTAGATSRAQSTNVYSVNGVSADTFLPAPHRPNEIVLWSCTYGTGPHAARVEWYVSTNALAKQPRWDGLSTEVPLSARKACTLAMPFVRQRLPHLQSLSVDSVLLRKPYLGERDKFPGVWYYEINFKPSAPEDRARAEFKDGYYATTQIVLLDGTVVPQTVLNRR